MPPTTPEDVLKRLVAATDEAKATIRELHEIRQDLIEIRKRGEQRIIDGINQAITTSVNMLRDEAREEMREAVSAVIGRLGSAWREKLGLDT